MKVVAERGKELNLDESLLNEVEATVGGIVTVTGAGLFDDNERLMPLVSDYLSEQLETRLLSIQSAKTYGQNLGYVLSYMKSRRDFASTVRDEAFIYADRPVYREYFKILIEDEDLEGNTARNRDATLMSFMNKYLCMAVGGRTPLKDANPYATGLLTPSPKSKQIKGCTTEELMALMQATSYERERCLLQCIYDVGLRRSEVPRVTLRDVLDALNFSHTTFISKPDLPPLNTDYCPILIQGSKGKGDRVKPRYSVVSRSTLLRIKAYHDSLLYRMYSRKYRKPEETPAFFNAEGDSYSANSVSKLLQRLSERAVSDGSLARTVSPHKLRHGNAAAMLGSPDLGADYLERLTITQKSLGHVNISTTERYNQIPMDLYRKMMDDNAVTVTRAQEMDALFTRTKIKIRPSDMK